MSTLARITLSAFVAAGSVLAVAAPAQAASTPVTSLTYELETDGEPITGTLTEPGAHFQSLHDRGIHRFNVSSGNTWISINLAAPVGAQLQPGHYPDAERAGFQTGRAPGLDVQYGSGGCNEVWGQFTVHQIGYDATGTVSMIEATFVNRCGPTAPAIRGTLKYRATPLLYKYTLTDQESTTPASHTYRGATSTFWAQSFWSSSVRFGASGNRMQDVVEFAPPAGERLTPGTTYRQVQPVGDQDPGRAGLTVERLRCRPYTGSFTIHELEYDAAGEPVALWATYSLRCTEYPSPEQPDTLTGTVRFHA